jgi:hypothetical protein
MKRFSIVDKEGKFRTKIQFFNGHSVNIKILKVRLVKDQIEIQFTFNGADSLKSVTAWPGRTVI